jgi:hypothetical protein
MSLSPGQAADQRPVLGQLGQLLQLGLGEQGPPLRRSEQTPRGPEDRLQVAYGVVGGIGRGGAGIGRFRTTRPGRAPSAPS